MGQNIIVAHLSVLFRRRPALYIFITTLKASVTVTGYRVDIRMKVVCFAAGISHSRCMELLYVNMEYFRL
jgi:hypothetical protein